jgi:hypothetical protein
MPTGIRWRNPVLSFLTGAVAFRNHPSPIDNAQREGVKCWVFRPSAATYDAHRGSLAPLFAVSFRSTDAARAK